ncbi:MAG: aminotransferase class V-fold PLP-dependent enzyme [Rubricoccaceae bacterium]|nr:aminotransferase class V-fold PLP-dependent enzyme [Rubricoccaceae bacterium]
MLDLRNQFFVPDSPAVELRAFTHGLMPKTVPAMMDRFVEDWRERGVDAWNSIPNHWRPESNDSVGWWSLPDYLGDAFIAPMLNAPKGTCILQPNVHWTMQGLLSSPEPFARGKNEVIITEAEFPSVQHSVRNWADLRGFRVVAIPLNGDGFIDVDALCAAVSDRTAWVFVSHVGFTTGEKLTDETLRAIADATHKHDALFGVDGYHATGSSVINVEAINADVYFGGLLKEACGSTGNAYLYIRNGLQLTPRVAGWLSDADPFGFHPDPEPHPSVPRRFLAGTTAIASLYHAVEGLRILESVGYEPIREDSLAKTEYAIARAEAQKIPIRSPREPNRRSAMVILDIPQAGALCEWLKIQEVFTDSRQNRYLRLSPFVWNTLDEIDRAFDVIADALRSGKHLETTLEKAGGPVT